MKRSIILAILDGWGIGRNDESNPIHVANPPTFKWLAETYPVTSIQASGIAVGLPWGEVGNSEVGHLTLGAGKVIYQYFPKITLAIRDESFFENPALKAAFTHAKEHGSAVNLAGILTVGNVHASLGHLEALLEMARREGVEKVKLHLFADGKDSPPKSAASLLKKIPEEKVATLIGRYYAMDREDRWLLIRRTYDCLTGGASERAASPEAALETAYAQNLTEEYLAPTRIGDRAPIEDGDALIFFNFREDSIREISDAFIDKNFEPFPVKQFPNLFVATMTTYRPDQAVPMAFPPDTVESPLGKVLADAGKTQLRLAETYKYAHVTYFFNGYREAPYSNEFRVIIPSDPSPHPDMRPAMRSKEITDRLVQSIEEKSFDFILANYASPDTIAHTGNYDAALETIKAVDGEISRLVRAVSDSESILIVTSDHGNIEEMLNPQTGRIETAHDPSPVPLYLIGNEFKGRKFLNSEDLLGVTSGSLADVSPTILELLGMSRPPKMTGKSILGELI